MQGTVSEEYPHLIFDNFQSTLGERMKNVLKYLFPVPKVSCPLAADAHRCDVCCPRDPMLQEDARRVMTFANRSDIISFRHAPTNSCRIRCSPAECASVCAGTTRTR